MYNKNYLAKRPFLIITNRFKPARGAQTQVANWAEKSGWEVHEEVMVVDRVTAKHLSMATAIIDVMEAKVVKNGFSESSREDIMTHFMTKYKSQITESIDIWMTRLATDKAMSEIVSALPVAQTASDETVVSTEATTDTSVE